MQLRCCGMHTSLFPTRRIRLIGQVRTSSARSLCILYPPAYLPFYRKANPSLPVLGSQVPYPATYPSLVFSFQIPSSCPLDFFFFLSFSFPRAFPPSLSASAPFLYFLPFCFLCLGSGPCCDRILFRNLILSSSPIFFDFAAPLRFLDLDGASLGVSTWDENLVQFDSIVLNPHIPH